MLSYFFFFLDAFAFLLKATERSIQYLNSFSDLIPSYKITLKQRLLRSKLTSATYLPLAGVAPQQ
jgi:hypothetical protein